MIYNMPKNLVETVRQLKEAVEGGGAGGKGVKEIHIILVEQDAFVLQGILDGTAEEGLHNFADSFAYMEEIGTYPTQQEVREADVLVAYKVTGEEGSETLEEIARLNRVYGTVFSLSNQATNLTVDVDEESLYATSAKVGGGEGPSVPSETVNVYIISTDVEGASSSGIASSTDMFFPTTYSEHPKYAEYFNMTPTEALFSCLLGKWLDNTNGEVMWAADIREDSEMTSEMVAAVESAVEELYGKISDGHVIRFVVNYAEDFEDSISTLLSSESFSTKGTYIMEIGGEYPMTMIDTTVDPYMVSLLNTFTTSNPIISGFVEFVFSDQSESGNNSYDCGIRSSRSSS